MPIWAFQKRIIGNPTPEKAAFVSSFADCDELFVINQRFLREGWLPKNEGIRQILVDKETGVNYLCWKSGYGAGITPLLDSEGKVIVTK